MCLIIQVCTSGCRQMEGLCTHLRTIIAEHSNLIVLQKTNQTGMSHRHSTSMNIPFPAYLESFLGRATVTHLNSFTGRSILPFWNYHFWIGAKAVRTAYNLNQLMEAMQIRIIIQTVVAICFLAYNASFKTNLNILPR